jgi:hypothetical protein
MNDKDDFGVFRGLSYALPAGLAVWGVVLVTAALIW